MAAIIQFIIAQFPIVMTAFALFISIIHVFNRKNRAISDIFLSYLFFFAVGLVGIWGFVFHAFFPTMAAEFIGWANSPFQFEVAVANLGMGVVGIFGLRATKSYRIAGAIFTTCFLWGAAYGHVVQIIQTHNFAPGNAGFIFYNDMLLPLLLIIFLIANKNK
jgi:hypothetical protein